MLKNKFLTFFFALIPGAAQMYQGYMKRGLSLITIFMAGILIACVFPLLGLMLAVVYMYNFFDALNLRQAIQEGRAPQDDYVIQPDFLRDGELNRLLKNHRLLGWGLLVLGLIGLYQIFVMPLLQQLFWMLKSPLYDMFYHMTRQLPQVALCIALMIVGLRLVRGPKDQGERPARPPLEMPPIPGEEEAPEEEWK